MRHYHTTFFPTRLSVSLHLRKTELYKKLFLLFTQETAVPNVSERLFLG